MSKLGVGVVGVGEMGKRHAENLAHFVPKARLVAVADTDLERARSVARELEIENAYDNVEALVARPDVQAIVIASPAQFHPYAIQAAAAAGKHILCEKPLALSLEEADLALEAVAKGKVQLQLGFMRRYDYAYAQAKKAIEEGEIGQPIIFKAIGRDFEAPPVSSFESGSTGTLLHDSSSHEFDLARWLMDDEVVEVHTFAATQALPGLAKMGLFDSAVVNLRFARGAIGNVESFMDARYGYDVRTEIVGTKGTIRVGAVHNTPVEFLTRPGKREDTVNHFLVRFAEAYVAEMRDFVESILSDRAPRITSDDGRQALAVVMAAVKSFKESRPVPVPAPKPVGLRARHIQKPRRRR